MSNLDSLKDAKSIASFSALLAVVASAAYFNNRITSIEDDLAEVKRHLSAIVPNADPKFKYQLESAIKAIKIIDSRVAETQNEIKSLASVPPVDSKIKSYKRLTPSQKSDNSSNLKQRSFSLKHDSIEDEDYLESCSDEDDVAVMRE